MAGREGSLVGGKVAELDPIAVRLANICGIGIWESDQFDAALFALLCQLQRHSPHELSMVSDHWAFAQQIWLDSAAPEPRVH